MIKWADFPNKEFEKYYEISNAGEVLKKEKQMLCPSCGKDTLHETIHSYFFCTNCRYKEHI